jgi:hypothetical protein
VRALVIPVCTKALISGHQWSMVAAKVNRFGDGRVDAPGEEPAQPVQGQVWVAAAADLLLLCSLLFNLAGQSLNHGPRSPDHGPSRGKHVSGGVMKPYPPLICDPGEHAQRG